MKTKATSISEHTPDALDKQISAEQASKYGEGGTAAIQIDADASAGRTASEKMKSKLKVKDSINKERTKERNEKKQKKRDKNRIESNTAATPLDNNAEQKPKGTELAECFEDLARKIHEPQQPTEAINQDNDVQQEQLIDVDDDAAQPMETDSELPIQTNSTALELGEKSKGAPVSNDENAAGAENSSGVIQLDDGVDIDVDTVHTSASKGKTSELHTIPDTESLQIQQMSKITEVQQQQQADEIVVEVKSLPKERIDMEVLINRCASKLNWPKDMLQNFATHASSTMQARLYYTIAIMIMHGALSNAKRKDTSKKGHEKAWCITAPLLSLLWPLTTVAKLKEVAEGYNLRAALVWWDIPTAAPQQQQQQQQPWQPVIASVSAVQHSGNDNNNNNSPIPNYHPNTTPTPPPPAAAKPPTPPAGRAAGTHKRKKPNPRPAAESMFIPSNNYSEHSQHQDPAANNKKSFNLNGDGGRPKRKRQAPEWLEDQVLLINMDLPPAVKTNKPAPATTATTSSDDGARTAGARAAAGGGTGETNKKRKADEIISVMMSGLPRWGAKQPRNTNPSDRNGGRGKGTPRESAKISQERTKLAAKEQSLDQQIEKVGDMYGRWFELKHEFDILIQHTRSSVKLLPTSKAYQANMDTIFADIQIRLNHIAKKAPPTLVQGVLQASAAGTAQVATKNWPAIQARAAGGAAYQQQQQQQKQQPYPPQQHLAATRPPPTYQQQQQPQGSVFGLPTNLPPPPQPHYTHQQPHQQLGIPVRSGQSAPLGFANRQSSANNPMQPPVAPAYTATVGTFVDSNIRPASAHYPPPSNTVQYYANLNHHPMPLPHQQPQYNATPYGVGPVPQHQYGPRSLFTTSHPPQYSVPPPPPPQQQQQQPPQQQQQQYIVVNESGAPANQAATNKNPSDVYDSLNNALQKLLDTASHYKFKVAQPPSPPPLPHLRQEQQAPPQRTSPPVVMQPQHIPQQQTEHKVVQNGSMLTNATQQVVSVLDAMDPSQLTIPESLRGADGSLSRDKVFNALKLLPDVVEGGENSITSLLAALVKGTLSPPAAQN